MPIQIPPDTIDALNHRVQRIVNKVDQLYALSESAANDIQAVRHTFSPDTPRSQPDTRHPWFNATADSVIIDCINAISANWLSHQAHATPQPLDFPALVAGDDTVIEQVKQLNASKAEFADAVKALRAQHRNLADTDIEAALNADLSTLNNAYLKASLPAAKSMPAPISIKKVAREIPVFDDTVHKVKFFYNRKIASRKRTVAAQRHIFENRMRRGEDTPQLADAIEILAMLPNDLVISERTPMATSITARCKVGTRNARWLQSAASTPIFIKGTDLDLERIADFSDLSTDPSSTLPRPHRRQRWAEQSFIPQYNLYLPADFIP